MRAALALLLGCSAPDLAELPPEEPRSLRAPPVEPAPAPPAEEAPPPAPPAPAPSSPALSWKPTPPDELPTAPFTAWTAVAPLTLVGQGGVGLATLRRAGVRVEVVQVLDHRLRLRCAGCEGAESGLEGWVQSGTVQAIGRAASGDALGLALRQRATWAGGGGPTSASPAALCALIDAGFEPRGERLVWSALGGEASLSLAPGSALELLRAPDVAPASGSSCRTTGLGR